MSEHAIQILIVDDQASIRELLSEYVALLGHRAVLAENGLSALVQMREKMPDLVLMDVMMPEMTGDEALEHMKADPVLRQVPVVMISAMDHMESVARCIAHGAEDYIVKPFEPEILKARIANCLEKKHLRDSQEALHHRVRDYNIRLEARVREEVRRTTEAQASIIFALSKLAESRDPETGEHLDRICAYCKVLASELSKQDKTISEEFIENVVLASPLHDVGKVGIPDHILLKPGKLSKEEFDIMKTHTTIGGDTLRSVSDRFPDNAFLQIGIAIAECHHEKWDGSGYPHGHEAQDIPLAARILALADVYDALTSKRVYKEAYSHEKSRAIVREGRGRHFDPNVVGAFDATEDEFRAVREETVDAEQSQVLTAVKYEVPTTREEVPWHKTLQQF